MGALVSCRSVCQQEQRNIMVPVNLMFIDNLRKMLQECPVEPLHHSIWLRAERCSPGLIPLQQFVHLCEQVRFEVPSLVCVQLQWNTVVRDPIFYKNFGNSGHLWLVLDMLRTICWNNQSPQGYGDCPFATLGNGPAKSMAILSNGCPTLYSCNFTSQPGLWSFGCYTSNASANPIFNIVFIGWPVKSFSGVWQPSW